MMSNDVGIDDINLSQEDEEPVKRPGARTSNYSTDEDEALESVCLDPITGNDQEGSTYWDRIADQYHVLVNNNSIRTRKSLQQRWCSIQSCCNRWAGCMDSVTTSPPSGTTIDDYLLKDNEKWRNRQ
ncbi:hypothetical protein EJB05_00784, partial [Eragrostis curvula]